MMEQNQKKNRSLPFEWFKPKILSYDEQLVEQWTVETNLDTIQQEGTLHRLPHDIKTALECSTSIDNHITDVDTHNSPTSDYETDSVDKDNDTAVIISVTPVTHILPSSSITNTTSSQTLTSNTAPNVPIVYFLDALAIEEKQKNNLAKEFLLTIGFGQMHEITNIVSLGDQPLRPTWINRSPDNNIEILPTSIHHEKENFSSSIEQKLHFATENQIEEDDTALIIHPHHLQYGHNLGDNIQGPLSSFFEPPYLHLPIINEIYVYRMSFHHEFPLFHPPDIFPHLLVSKTEENDIHLPSEYQINQSEILSFPHIHDLSDNEEEPQIISYKLDQPSYIEHYHVQPLHPFPETCYAQINQPEILIKNDVKSEVKIYQMCSSSCMYIYSIDQDIKYYLFKHNNQILLHANACLYLTF